MKTMIQSLGTSAPAQPVKAKADGDAPGFAQLLSNVMETIETIQPESQPPTESHSSEKQTKEEHTLPFIPLLTLRNVPVEKTSKPLPSSKDTKEANDALSSLLSQMSPDKGKPSEIKLPGFIKSELLKLDPDVEQLVEHANSKIVPVEELKTAIAKVIVENNEALTKKEQSNLLASLKSSEVDGVMSMKDSLATLMQKVDARQGTGEQQGTDLKQPTMKDSLATLMQKVDIRQGTGEQLGTEAKQPAESLPQPEMETAGNFEAAKMQVDEQPESLQQVKTSEAPSQSLVKESNTPVPVRQVSTSLSDMIMERIQVMKNGDESHIRIKLSPENLGQLDIRLTTSDGKVTAFIATATSAAKEMIESQLHQLRQTLVQQGVQLDKVEVIQQPSSPSQSSMLQDGRSHQGQQFEQGQQHRGERRDEYEVDDNPLITQDKEEEISGINYAV